MARRNFLTLTLAALCSGSALSVNPFWVQALAQAWTQNQTLGMRRDGAGELVPVMLRRWSLIYFGYTHCPDICPTGLQTLAETLEQIGPFAGALDALFVTVDPERDTPELMRDYVAAFHPALIGVSPNSEELAAMVALWRIKFRKVAVADGPYLMDHTAWIFLITPDGRVVGRFSHAAAPTVIGEKIRSLMTR